VIESQLSCDRYGEPRRASGTTRPAIRVQILPGRWIMADVCHRSAAEFLRWLANRPKTVQDGHHGPEWATNASPDGAAATPAQAGLGRPVDG
jgi:hypothetical protein